jgi:hypothetical protein
MGMSPVRGALQPRYANTHAESSGTGLQTTRLREDARQMIREAVGGTDDDLVIFCGSGATAAVVTKLIRILELRIPAGLDERFGFSGHIPETVHADNGLSHDLHGPSGRGTAWRSPPRGRLAATRDQCGAQCSDQSHGGLRQPSWASMPRGKPYPLRQIIGDSRRGPVPALLTGPLTTDAPAITSAGHAIEASLGPACGSSRSSEPSTWSLLVPGRRPAPTRYCCRR